MPGRDGGASRLGGFDQGSNVTVFQDQASGLACSTDGNIHHSATQIIRPDHLIGEHQAKHGVDCSQ
jgi:hypothetical protein